MKLKNEYLKSAEYLENELLKIHVKSDSEQFINLKGLDPIFDKVKEILKKLPPVLFELKNCFKKGRKE